TSPSTWKSCGTGISASSPGPSRRCGSPPRGGSRPRSSASWGRGTCGSAHAPSGLPPVRPLGRGRRADTIRASPRGARMPATERRLFTSESVTEGHPDKVADQISDAVLDAILAIDAKGRVACETLLTTGLCIVAGEITTRGYVDLQKLARRTIESIGYTDAAFGLDAASCSVLSAIDEQSGDIAMGVDTGGAGDQGMVFGYACRETEELMPMPIMLAHGLTRRLASCRKNGIVPHFRPDGKSQVTVEYRDGKPARVDAIVVSTQHGPEVTNAALEEAVREAVIKPTIPSHLLDDKTKIWINPTGRFVTGG